LDDRREEEYRADMMESNLRYNNAFDTVLSHTPAMEIADFWHLFGEEDGGGMVEVDADIDLGVGFRSASVGAEQGIDLGAGTRLSNDPGDPFAEFYGGKRKGSAFGNTSNPMVGNPMFKDEMVDPCQDIDLGAGTRLSNDPGSLFGGEHKVTTFEFANPMRHRQSDEEAYL
jgi:hypothetical protein